MTFYLDAVPDSNNYIPGDANYSGAVDQDDAAILAAHWLETGCSWETGDFNGDGKVDDVDATLLATNWNSGEPIGLASVPEPSAIVLLIAGLLSLLACNRQYK